jgi:hypothetical protein
MYHYFSEEATYAVSFQEIISINCRNLIRIVGAALEKIAILCFGGYLKGSCFWSWNVCTHEASGCERYILACQI